MSKQLNYEFLYADTESKSNSIQQQYLKGSNRVTSTPG
jgi:hypothetical protein